MYWYEENTALYENEVKEMNRQFPQFELRKLSDGRLCWIGTVKPECVRNAEWTLQLVYDHNHPINSVFDKLRSLKYGDRTIPFPVLRLGNADKVKESLEYMRDLYNQVESINVFEKTLDKRKDDRKERAKRLTELLKVYEDYIDLNERKETISRLIEYHESMATSPALFPFELDLQGRQLKQIEDAISATPKVTEDDALKLMDRNEEEFLQYLYYVNR